MRKFSLIFGLFVSMLSASQELWVVYHNGCSRCEAFLEEVVSSYPNRALVEHSAFLPIKLLDVSMPMHQQLIMKIKPMIYSTPTFLVVEKSSAPEIKVLGRWTGYQSMALFYKQLNEVLSTLPKA